jgi:hypothetical protein
MDAIVAPPRTETRALNAKIWERGDLDFYVEPPRATEQLLAVERFVGHIWDPSCGGGNILDAALARGYGVVGTDIKKRCDRHWFRGEHDFLAWDQPSLAQNIVCNPPFFRAKGAEAFIVKALQLAVGKVAMFVDIRFLAGDARANGLFDEHPPSRIWVVTPRVSCPPGEWLAAGNKAGNGSSDWCWLIYDLTAPIGPTTFGWLKQSSELRKP